MRRFLIAAAIAATFSLSASLPAAAQTIEIGLAPAFQKKIDKDYGVREVDELTSELQKRVARALAAKGASPARVVLTLEDARPNKPTLQQLFNRPGLNYMRSMSNGGAEVKGVAYDAQGQEIGVVDYHWYESDISLAQGKSVWWDARRAFDGFARRLADKLA